MAAKKALKFHGKPAELALLLGVEGRLLATLEALPKDEIFTNEQIADRAKVNVHTLYNLMHKPRLEGRHYRVGRRTFWGHRAAIAELRRQIGVER